MKKKIGLFVMCLVVLPCVFLLASCCGGEATKITEVDGIKTEYIYKEPLATQGDVTLTYDNGDTETVDISALDIAGLSTDSLGSYRMRISYGDFDFYTTYDVNCKSIRKDETNWLPSNFITGQNIYLNRYKLDIESYEGFETITLDDDAVKIVGLSTDVLDENSRYIYDGVATITCGGQSLTHNYSVWYTDGYNDALNGSETKENFDRENYIVSVENLRIMQAFGADGRLVIKSTSGSTLTSYTITSWQYGTFLDLYSNGRLVAKYDYHSKYLYVMSDVFSQFNYEISLTLS